MRPTLAVTFLLFAAATLVGQGPDLDRLKQKPIAVGRGKVGDLLRQWWKEGTASGNAGDFYDNRDGDHSPLSLAPYPQLTLFPYSPTDFAAKRNWAAAREIRPHVTFGNSSTSAPAHLGGSNPRSYYVSPLGLAFLYQQYRKNNLYIYPEHRDHDPGHNGLHDGYGDLYPTNTPYLIISQGSSGTDQPFMRMMPSVLAAFRPEVKAKLIETGTLMPTIQMLFRSTNKHLKDPTEYVSAKAHPSVFEGAWVDELALVQKAHALDLKSLPPMVQLRVLEDNKAVNGIDYFDLVGSEAITYTPACIARIHRSKANRQRIVVSADGSYDLNKQPLTYTWVVLRGDPNKIKIVPKKDDRSTVEIIIAYQGRMPIAAGNAIESNRVDIGVFVHNGTHYSAPGFVTLHTLDREARVYDKAGKLLEIAHGMGEAELRITDWQKLLTRITSDAALARLLNVNADQKRGLANIAEIHQTRVDAVTTAQAGANAIEKTLKDVKDSSEKGRMQKSLNAARQELTKAQKSAQELLDRKLDPLAGSTRQFVETRLAKLMQDPLFTHHQSDWLKERRSAANGAKIASAWQKLARLGIAQSNGSLTPLMPGKTPEDANWTKFEKAQLEWLHATMLAEIAFPGMTQVWWHANYTDHRLSVPREWRDNYHYDPKGESIGWTRRSAEGVQDFNHEGLLILEKDGQGRGVKARTVRYVQAAPKGNGINTNPLRAVPGDTLVRYEFADADDWRGRRAGDGIDISGQEMTEASMSEILRTHARQIWDAAVEAVRPAPLVQAALADLDGLLRAAPRILVLGAGKAGAAMAEAVEAGLADRLDGVEGIVNVPADAVKPLRRIRLHAARPAAANFPTPAGVAGAEAMLRLSESAGPSDVALCLLSGGGSALLPAPAPGITLEDKLAVTKLLHQCGATINEMNAVRKHLSAIKGGRLAQAFHGKALVSLIISDVVGDPLDVIASGPTAPDPSTFADALAILDRFHLHGQVPAAVLAHLGKGSEGKITETPKSLPPTVQNRVLGNNVKALAAAQQCAETLGYRVLNLGSFIEGETRDIAIMHAGIVRSIREQSVPSAPPLCVLSGGETTVTLSANAGKGGRNQEFVLAALLKLGMTPNVAILSGGTDGEDGPTDAAGACADDGTLRRATSLGLDGQDCLLRNDAYPFFDATGDLLKTGLTQTNVMDVRVLLIAP